MSSKIPSTSAIWWLLWCNRPTRKSSNKSWRAKMWAFIENLEKFWNIKNLKFQINQRLNLALELVEKEKTVAKLKHDINKDVEKKVQEHHRKYLLHEQVGIFWNYIFLTKPKLTNNFTIILINSAFFRDFWNASQSNRIAQLSKKLTPSSRSTSH